MTQGVLINSVVAYQEINYGFSFLPVPHSHGNKRNADQLLFYKLVFYHSHHKFTLKNDLIYSNLK